MNQSKTLLIVAGFCVVAALGVATGLLVAGRTAPVPGARPPAADSPAKDAAYDEAAALKAAQPIDASMIKYRQTALFPVGIKTPHGLAVGPENDFYVAGDKLLRRFSAAGKQTAEIALRGTPTCLAVGARDHVAPGRVYVGMEEHLETFDPTGKPVEVWKTLGDKAVITAIGTSDHDVFIADAGNKVVWRFDPKGGLKNRIGALGESAESGHFLVSGPYFSLAVGGDDLVYVVNPRALRIEGYTFDGFQERKWGQGSPAVSDFFGCCNPAYLAVLPDGRFVTAEKGIPRVKVFGPDGRFEGVVVGPEQMNVTAAGLATDRQGRILVLDPTAAAVRVFEENIDAATKKARAAARENAILPTLPSPSAEEPAEPAKKKKKAEDGL